MSSRKQDIRRGILTKAALPGAAELRAVKEGASASASSVPDAMTAPGGEEKPRTPPPDLPSMLLDSRVVFLGMPLQGAVTELMIAQLLYLQHMDRLKPIYFYINSTGTARADGEPIGHETEATAVYDTMCYISNNVYTVATGQAVGQACLLLSCGTPGRRYMMPHSTAMLHQPRSPPTGTRQAVEVQVRAREVNAQKDANLRILHETTGQPVEKLDRDLQRPLYMTPNNAIAYGVADRAHTSFIPPRLLRLASLQMQMQLLRLQV